MSQSVQPEWCTKLTLQQQSVLFLAARGPDGVEKFHPCKGIQKAYRACVLVPAKHSYMNWGTVGDDFMDLSAFSNTSVWAAQVKKFIDSLDSLPHHYLMHIMHGAQILGYKHPDERFRERWNTFYRKLCDNFHLNYESESEMDKRLWQ